MLAQLVLTLPVVWLGRHFYVDGIKALLRKAPAMDSLVAVGTGAAFLFSLGNTLLGLAGSEPMSVALLASLLCPPLAPLRCETGTKPTSAGNVLHVLGQVARNRRLWFIGCCHGFSFGTITALGNWLSVMLADSASSGAVAGSSNAEAWALSTSLVLLAGTMARIAGGELGRAVPKQKLLVSLVLGIGLFYLLLALAGSTWMLLACAFALAVCCGGTYASVFTLTIEAAGASHTATGIGFMRFW